MKLKNRALTLGVTAGMVGALVTVVGVTPAGAATTIADNCGIYMQGAIDPTGGLLPAGVLGNPATNDDGQQAYIARGHESKGGNKVISNLNDATPGGTRFSLNVTIGGTNGTLTPEDEAPVLSRQADPTPPHAELAGGTTAVKVQWKNDKAAGGPLHPQVQVSEKAGAAKATVAKGFSTGVTGADTLGPAIGNVSQSAPVTFALATPKAATSGTYQIAMVFPAFAGPPLGGQTVTTTLNYDDTAAEVQSAIQASFAPFVGPGAFTVTGTNWSASTDGNYTIAASGALTAAPSLPSWTVVEGSVTGTLADTILSDGSVWNSRRNGGNDPSVGIISDLGQGIYSAQGVMSSGDIPTPPAKTTGKANFQNDTQYLFLHYPADLPLAFVPDLETNPAYAGLVGLLQAIAPSIVVTQDSCDVLGLLALFCFATPGQIPAAFSGICTALGA